MRHIAPPSIVLVLVSAQLLACSSSDPAPAPAGNVDAGADVISESGTATETGSPDTGADLATDSGPETTAPSGDGRIATGLWTFTQLSDNSNYNPRISDDGETILAKSEVDGQWRILFASTGKQVDVKADHLISLGKLVFTFGAGGATVWDKTGTPKVLSTAKSTFVGKLSNDGAWVSLLETASKDELVLVRVDGTERIPLGEVDFSASEQFVGGEYVFGAGTTAPRIEAIHLTTRARRTLFEGQDSFSIDSKNKTVLAGIGWGNKATMIPLGGGTPTTVADTIQRAFFTKAGDAVVYTPSGGGVLRRDVDATTARPIYDAPYALEAVSATGDLLLSNGERFFIGKATLPAVAPKEIGLAKSARFSPDGFWVLTKDVKFWDQPGTVSLYSVLSDTRKEVGPKFRRVELVDAPVAYASRDLAGSFEVGHGNNQEIVEINLASGSTKVVATDAQGFRVTPDGKHLVYPRWGKDTAKHGLYTIKP